MADLLIPPAIVSGDTIAIVAPSGQIHNRNRFEGGVRILQDMGFVVRFPQMLWPGYGYFADNDQNRAAEFNRAWADPDVKALVTARGGFGCLRILEQIDLNLIRSQPKLFIGFSDITVLQTYLQEKIGLLTLHGPVLTSLAGSERSTIERLANCLNGAWTNPISWKGIEVLRAGDYCRGILAGGNLSSIISLLGTPFQPQWQGKIIFLEDTAEPFYRIDRMLSQLYYAGLFNEINGLILGDFSLDKDQDPTRGLRLHEGIWQRALELTSTTDIPVWGGFPVGHGRNNLPLPIGAETIMDSGTATLKFC